MTDLASSSTRAGDTDRCRIIFALPGPQGPTRRLFTLRPVPTGPSSRSSNLPRPAPRQRVCYDVALDSCTPYRRGGTPELRFSRVLGPLTTLPDPWMGQQCAWFHSTSNLAGATCYFTGDVTSYVDRYDHDLGWVREYRALGLRNRADWIPVTDPQHAVGLDPVQHARE